MGLVMGLQLTIQANDQITPALRALAGKMRDLTPVNRSIGVALAALAKRAFDEPGLRPALPKGLRARGSTLYS